MEATLPVIIRDVLKLNVMESEEIPDDVQHTKERKPDALKKVTDSNGSTFILHLEFQVADDQEMVYRMLEYSSMLLRRYKLPLKQYVIFLGEAKPTMPVSIDTENHKFKYHLIRIIDADYRLFLRAEHPEVKVLAILANLNTQPVQDAVEMIVNEVETASDGELLKGKYLKHLRIFVQLRKSVEQQFLQVMESVSTFFREEDDVFYKKGEAHGKAAVVENLLIKLGFSDEKAAEIAEVSIDFVKQVRASIAR